MKRAYILLIIVFLLVFSAFAISFGWYYGFKHAVKEALGIEENVTPPAQQTEVKEENLTSPAAPEKVIVTLGERAAYRKPSGAQIVVMVKNEGWRAGSAKIYAELVYRQMPVANNSVTIPLIQPGQEINATINIQYFNQWNAFDVRQI